MPPKIKQKKKPVSAVRNKVLDLHLARIQMGQLSGRMSVNDIKRFREMFCGTSHWKFSNFLMRAGLFSMLFRRLIATPGQSTATSVTPFRYPMKMVKTIVSAQNSPFKKMLETFNSSRQMHSMPVKSVAADSEKIVTGSDDNTTKVVDKSSSRVFTLQHNSGVSCVAIDPSGLLVATGSKDGTIKFWKIIAGSWYCIATYSGHTDVVTSIAFHTSLPLFVSSSNDKTAKVWVIDAQIISATCVTTLTGHTRDVNAAAFHPSLPIIATASDDGTVKMCLLAPDFLSYKVLTTLTGHSNYVTSVAFHPVLPLLATGCRDGKAKIWLLSADGTSATCIADLEEHRERILSVAFHPVLPLLATCGYDRVVKLWLMSPDFSSVSCVANLVGHNGPITGVKFDGDNLLTCGSDGTVNSW
jgi:WD40 repeat protein